MLLLQLCCIYLLSATSRAVSGKTRCASQKLLAVMPFGVFGTVPRSDEYKVWYFDSNSVIEELQKAFEGTIYGLSFFFEPDSQSLASLAEKGGMPFPGTGLEVFKALRNGSVIACGETTLKPGLTRDLCELGNTYKTFKNLKNLSWYDIRCKAEMVYDQYTAVVYLTPEPFVCGGAPVISGRSVKRFRKNLTAVANYCKGCLKTDLIKAIKPMPKYPDLLAIDQDEMEYLLDTAVWPDGKSTTVLVAPHYGQLKSRKYAFCCDMNAWKPGLCPLPATTVITTPTTKTTTSPTLPPSASSSPIVESSTPTSDSPVLPTSPTASLSPPLPSRASKSRTNDSTLQPPWTRQPGVSPSPSRPAPSFKMTTSHTDIAEKETNVEVAHATTANTMVTEARSTFESISSLPHHVAVETGTIAVHISGGQGIQSLWAANFLLVFCIFIGEMSALSLQNV